MHYLTLNNIPTKALQDWVEAHYYYLPENTTETLLDWTRTMLTLTEQLEKRGIKTSLKFENLD